MKSFIIKNFQKLNSGEIKQEITKNEDNEKNRDIKSEKVNERSDNKLNTTNDKEKSHRNETSNNRKKHSHSPESSRRLSKDRHRDHHRDREYSNRSRSRSRNSSRRGDSKKYESRESRSSHSHHGSSTIMDMELDTEKVSEITYVSDIINENENGISIYTKKEALDEYKIYKNQLTQVNERIEELDDYIQNLCQLIEKYSQLGSKKHLIENSSIEEVLMNNDSSSKSKNDTGNYKFIKHIYIFTYVI